MLSIVDFLIIQFIISVMCSLSYVCLYLCYIFIMSVIHLYLDDDVSVFVQLLYIIWILLLILFNVFPFQSSLNL